MYFSNYIYKEMKKIILFITAIVGFLSCSEKSSNDTVNLTVEPSSLTFSSDGGTANLTITSNTDWSITTSSEEIKAVPSSGSGNKIVQVNVPQRKIIEQRNDKLVIKSSDGSVIHNIDIIQEGYITSGEELRVSNQGNYMAFSGKAQSLDSLKIISSAPWELRGPEWIEAYNGSRWVSLSSSRAMITGNATLLGSNEGTTIVYIRTANNNQSAEDQVGELILSQQYSGNLKYNINIIQLGVYRVAPNLMSLLSDGMATNWKFGNEVESFYWTVTTKAHSAVDPTEDKNSEWVPTSSDEHLVSWWTGLEENTTYNINICTQSRQRHWYYDSYYFKTGSSKNQALAFIENVYNDGTMWRWQVRPNERCKLFAIIGWDDPDLFYVPDVYLSWLIQSMGFPLSRLQEGNTYNSYSWKNNNPIQLVSWGVGKEMESTGTHISSVITRYRTIDHSSVRSQYKDGSSTVVGSTTVDNESIKKSMHIFTIDYHN